MLARITCNLYFPRASMLPELQVATTLRVAYPDHSSFGAAVQLSHVAVWWLCARTKKPVLHACFAGGFRTQD